MCLHSAFCLSLSIMSRSHRNLWKSGKKKNPILNSLGAVRTGCLLIREVSLEQAVLSLMRACSWALEHNRQRWVLVAGPIDRPRQGKVVNLAQQPSMESSQEQQKLGLKTGLETGLQHRSKGTMCQTGLGKDTATAKLRQGRGAQAWAEIRLQGPWAESAGGSLRWDWSGPLRPPSALRALILTFC